MTGATNVQTVTLSGQRFVILPEQEYQQLLCADLPPADDAGNRPAVAAMRAIIGRDIVRDRQRIGWSQVELARRAGIRVETLNRIETGKHSPSAAMMQKIDVAFQTAKKSTRRKSSKRRKG